MNFVLHGYPVSSGITVGNAHLVSTARLEVAHYEVAPDKVEAEVERFDRAMKEAQLELAELKSHIPPGSPAEFEAFLDLHRMILNDSALAQAPRELIRKRRANAEWALVQQMERLVERFDEIDDPYLRERKADVQQAVERVLKEMTGKTLSPPAASEEEKLIVVAHDLSPADMILFKKHRFGGFVTDVGGVTSHTAIVARSLGIPAIVGLHHAHKTITEGETLIVDGIQGLLIVNPDPLVLAEYRARQAELKAERKRLKRLKSTPAATVDGTPIELFANIELPQDMSEVLEAGAEGVGLFRSEFMFLNRKDLPSEDEQFEAYREVAQAMKGRPVVLRTLDLGADKALNNDGSHTMPNPAMGLRAIRFCLAEPQMFLTQLRAILRASHYGKVRILLPMLAHAHEIDQTLALINQAKAQLDQREQPYDKDIPIGGMIEIPAAALALPIFMRRLNFLSIGTNDLIQYTLAIDRTDDSVAHLYDPLHPAVLTLVAGTIQTATRGGVPVAVCGEMAGDLQLTRLLLGLGLRNFSMHPSQLLPIKERILKTNLAEVQALAQRVLRASDPGKTRELLSKLNA
jgi:phosphotransferase system enzyme I (PtsI)